MYYHSNSIFVVEYDVTIDVGNIVNMDFIFGRQTEEMLDMIECSYSLRFFHQLDSMNFVRHACVLCE